MSANQVLSVAQMQAAEQAIFDTGISVDALMDTAASGAADWIVRAAAGRAITVLCGPGNNGGDGYVIARRLIEAGNQVAVVAPVEPKTDAARNARSAYAGPVHTAGGAAAGDVLVDCLFGSGLSRPMTPEHALLLRDLAARHPYLVAIDLPSGIASDSGAQLNEKLPEYDLTLALGAWKFAHWCLPARAIMGVKRLVPIGIDRIANAAHLVARPQLTSPALDSHKYTRGLCLVVAGAMPGAAQLACIAAMRAGAGYVQMLAGDIINVPPDLVVRSGGVEEAISDPRIRSVLIGPGLGRDDAARAKLTVALSGDAPCVIDADGLTLLQPSMVQRERDLLLTPHDGELEALCKSFAVIAEGRRARAQALAKASRAVVLAKGPDSVIASPDGRLALVPPAPTWLSVAGSGDVLAGIAASRLASGKSAFDAACDAAWIHGQAARMTRAPFTALELARSVASAYRAAL